MIRCVLYSCKWAIIDVGRWIYSVGLGQEQHDSHPSRTARAGRINRYLDYCIYNLLTHQPHCDVTNRWQLEEGKRYNNHIFIQSWHHRINLIVVFITFVIITIARKTNNNNNLMLLNKCDKIFILIMVRWGLSLKYCTPQDWINTNFKT